MTLLLSLVLKGAAVLLVAALCVRLLHRAPASLRHGIWAAAFGALLLLPVLEAAGPRWSVAMLPSQAPAVPSSMAIPAPPPPPPPAPPAPPAPLFEAAVASEATSVTFGTEAAEFETQMESFEAEMRSFEGAMEAYGQEMESTSRTMSVVRATSTRPASPIRSLGGCLLTLWAVGAGLVTLWWLGAAVSAHRLVGHAQPETDEDWSVVADHARRLSGLDEPVRLLRSRDLDVPIAWGYGSPAVVLPESADEWDEDRREAVLLHEMAHLRRRDAWTQVVAQAAVAVHWFNPLAWWGYRQHLDAREQACDDAVIQGGARPSAYAAHLVGVARSIRREPIALTAVAPMARTAPLETRIHSILDADRRRGQLGRLAKIGTAALALGIVLPVAAFQPVEAEAALDDNRPVLENTSLDAPVSKAVLEDEPEACCRTSSQEAAREETPSRSPAEVRADTLDEVRAHIRQAQAEVRRAMADARGADVEIARIRLGALQEAERALEDLNLEAIQREAGAGVREAMAAARAGVRQALLEAEEDRREARLEADEDRREALLEAEEDRREAYLEAEEDRRDALEEARDARDEAREALSQVDMPRVWSEAKRGLGDTWPIVRSVSRAAPPAPPIPGATPRPPAVRSSAVSRSASRSTSRTTRAVDWNSIDRARTEAVRRAGPDHSRR